MHKSLTVNQCLARAYRMRGMADRADSYSDLLLYDSLADEWLELAGRLAARRDCPTVEPTAPTSPPKPRRRSLWHKLELLGHAWRLK